MFRKAVVKVLKRKKNLINYIQTPTVANKTKHLQTKQIFLLLMLFYFEKRIWNG